MKKTKWKWRRWTAKRRRRAQRVVPLFSGSDKDSSLTVFASQKRRNPDPVSRKVKSINTQNTLLLLLQRVRFSLVGSRV